MTEFVGCLIFLFGVTGMIVVSIKGHRSTRVECRTLTDFILQDPEVIYLGKDQDP
jgi:hypothetical protein